ncbi:MAG: S8 family serine peptidase, partial [candidate division WOR-3 bacterium]|nr:S8 family serine peptidase [candidate division WOR-3 bacterium]
MRKAFALFFLPFLLLAATGPFIDGQVLPTATHLYRDPTVIHLPCGIDLDTRDAEPTLPANLMLSAGQEGIGTYLVQFDGPIYSHERRALEQAGVGIEGYLPNYTYIVRMDQATRARVETLQGVGWVGNYEPGYKLCPEIDLEASIPEKLVVTLYAGIDGEAIREAVETLGGELLEWQATDFQTFVHIMLAPQKLPLLVHEPQIKWVEPYRQPYLMNGQAQWVIQTWEEDNRRIWDEGITGEGQILATLDTGIKTTHNFFRDPSVPITDFGDYPTHRKIIAYQKPAYDPDGVITFGDESGHGTHTAGSVLGNDQPVGGSSVNIGMAPDARIYFLDGGGGGGGIIHAVSLEYSFSIAYNGNSAGGARIISNSWGSQTTRAYDKSCVESDQTMWNRPDYLVMFSAGNNPPSTYTGSPANAKNVIAVGGCLNGTAANFYWSGSSQGPANDGRIRPDIVAPGKDVTSAWRSSDDAELTTSGTSMASPIAAGNAGLIRQYFTDGWYPSGSPGSQSGFNPSAALLKAMMINSVETDFPSIEDRVPSKRVGWGRPKLDNVLYFPGDARKLAVVDFDEGLETGYQFLGKVNVAGSGEPIRITMNWTDYPGELYASPALVNDLNLEVVSPSGKVYRGNNFSDNVSVEGGDFDTKNPVENVFVNSPETGEWEIRVHANNVPAGPQPFALVVTGELSTLISAVAIEDITVDDDGQSNPDGNMDPGENVTLYVQLLNAGENALHNITSTLSSSSSYVTITGNDANYGTLNPAESKQGDGFEVTVSPSAPLETWVKFQMQLSADELSGSLNFELMIGTPRYKWISHDVGNVKLTVTEQGAVGFYELDGPGEGFRYPKSSDNWLYHASFAAGNSKDFMNDRMYGEGESHNKGKDWKVTSDPDGRVIIGRHDHSDQDSRAIYNNDGNWWTDSELKVQQFGYAWKEKDYVILKFVLINPDTSSLEGMYAGIMADFDMGPEQSPYNNSGGTDQTLNLVYMKQAPDKDNPHVGIKLLKGQKANVTLVSNPDYVWDYKWNDETFFKFLSGELSFASAPNDTDWSVIVSAGPFDLPVGGTDTVAFAFLAGDNL